MAGIVWHGVREFNAALDKAVTEAYAAGRKGANNAAALVSKTTQEKLRKTTHKRGTPTPSRPGEPPSLVSGQLRRSMKIVPAVPLGATAWKAEVGPTAAYARIQELGGTTGRGGELPARPYLEPSVQELIDSGALWAAFRSGYGSF
jgi:phage gpG-like protein